MNIYKWHKNCLREREDFMKEKNINTEEKKFHDNYVSEEIPQRDRQHWIPVALVWIGCMICVSSILVGQELISGMGFYKAIFAGIIGYLLILILTTFQGKMASDLGRPTVVTAKPCFGEGIADFLFSIIVSVAFIGWFGVQSTIAGQSVQQFFVFFGVDLSLTMSTIIISLFMTISAVYGFKAMEKLNAIAVPLLIIVLIYSSIVALKNTNLSFIGSYKPYGEPITFINGISIVFGSFVVGAALAGDFTRYNKNRKDTFKSAAFGIAPIGVLLLAIGALLAVTANSPDTDIIVIMTSNLPFPIIGVITLILATWTTNVTNAYSAGISLVNAFKLKSNKRAIVTFIAGGVGTILAIIGILDYFIMFLSILTAFVAPVAGVMIADYWIINKGNPEGYMEKESKSKAGIIAWFVGTAPGLLVTIFPNILNSLISSILGICGLFISIIVYLILKKMEGSINV